IAGGRQRETSSCSRRALNCSRWGSGSLNKYMASLLVRTIYERTIAPLLLGSTFFHTFSIQSHGTASALRLTQTKPLEKTKTRGTGERRGERKIQSPTAIQPRPNTGMERDCQRGHQLKIVVKK